MKDYIKTILFAISFFMCTALIACGSRGTATQGAPAKNEVPSFDADSAYAFVAAQTAFGPRVPGTTASRECAQWLLDKLRSYGGATTEQHTTVQAYNGDILDICNISARFNPQASKRVLLLAHYDSRPWADYDPDPTLRDKPIDGANDGASGVGVILEVARQIALQQPKVGVDVLFVDAEDYGHRQDDADSDPAESERSWCLGSQYWTQNPSFDTSNIRYAVLLDMVGGKNASFPKEQFSQYAHPDIVNKVWKAAEKAGYGERFPKTIGAPVLDDHLQLIMAGIPAIDIIETETGSEHAFNPTWHTHADNIDNIDRQTLKAVGQTLLHLIYNE